MKKIIALSALAILASNTAEASKARLLALGENLETAGSLYFSDNRNIFQNAAFINDYSDAIYLEWGANGAASNKADGDTTPQAEGGFLRTHGAYVYGLHLGAESYITHEARNYFRLHNANGAVSLPHQDNQVDAFFGSTMANDIKWGLNVTYSNTKEDADKMKQKSASIRFGLMGKKWEGYANVAVMNEAELRGVSAAGAPVGKDKFEGNKGWELGGSYDLGFARAFGYWRHGSWDQELDSATLIGGAAPGVGIYTGKTEFDTNRVRLGLGREKALNDRTTLFTKVEYVMTKREVKAKGGSARGTVNADDYYVPVTIGLEHDATSWLTLRGSVTQYLVSEQDNSYSSALLAANLPPHVNPAITTVFPKGKRSMQNSTNVNAGMTLKFGDLSIDGVIGTSTGAGAIGDTKSEKGVLSLDNLASRVAMTYRF